MHFAWQFSVSLTCAESGRTVFGRHLSDSWLPSQTLLRYSPDPTLALSVCDAQFSAMLAAYRFLPIARNTSGASLGCRTRLPCLNAGYLVAAAKGRFLRPAAACLLQAGQGAGLSFCPNSATLALA